jgi:hypothetical protein
MKETSNQHDPNQVLLSEQFAAPDLYKNDPYYGNNPIDFSTTSDAEIDRLFSLAQSGKRDYPGGRSLMSLDSIPLCNDQSSLDSTPFVQRAVFHMDKIIVYPEFLPDRSFPTPQRGKIENLTRGQFNGYIGRSACIKIRKRLEAWIKSVHMHPDRHSVRNRPKHTHIVFFTLTLPVQQRHSDQEIRRSCLMPFFQQLKRGHGVDCYFASSEVQRNGNVHFHVLVDRYIDKTLLQDQWNSSLDNLGYLAEYIEKTGEIRPPTTQIMECPDDMSIVKYVMKYVSKQPEVRLSCYPPDMDRPGISRKRNDWKYCKERTGEGGRIVKRSERSPEKVVQSSYWKRDELKGGLSEVHELGLQVLSDQVERIGERWFECYEIRPVEGRCWSMSKKLQSIEVPKFDVSYRIRDLISVLRWDPTVRITQGDYHEVYHCNVFDKLMRLDPVLLSDYRTHFVKTYRQLYERSEIEICEVPPVPDIVEPGIKVDPPPDWEQLKLAV